MKKSKILVSTALALCMGATAVIPAFAAENQKFTYTKIGDYNADNAVDISDVTALQLQLVGNEVITGAMLEHLDFNGDGGFNVNDVSEIQKKIVGTDYECYKPLGDSYNNVTEETQYYYYDEEIPGKGIPYEIIYNENNGIVTMNEFDSIKRCNFLQKNSFVIYSKLNHRILTMNFLKKMPYMHISVLSVLMIILLLSPLMQTEIS